MRVILGALLIAGLLGAAPEKPPKTKKATGKAASTSHKSRKRGKSARVRKAAAPSYQLHPDAERYQQIQQALAERGYFKGTADGKWGDDSVEALKRFQADQKLEPDGKINALSLTGLGLGPKHDGTSAGTVPLAATSNPEVPPVGEVPAGSEPPAGNEPQAGTEPQQ